MTLYELIHSIQNIGASQPNILFVTQGDIYELNHNQEVDYPAFVVTESQHLGSIDDEYEQYGMTLFVVDRLVSDKSNELDVKSWANATLVNIIEKIEEANLGFVLPGFRIQTFTEKFDSVCAGAFASIVVQTTITDCVCGAIRTGVVTSVNGQTGDVIINGVEGRQVTSVNGQTGDVYLKIPSKVSELVNDAGYLSEVELSDYYTKEETYSIQQTNALVNSLKTNIQNNYYNKEQVDQKIKDVSVEIDLKDYYKKSETYNKKEVDDKIKDVSVDLSDYYTKEETYNKEQVDSKIAQAGVSSVKSVNGQTGDVILNYVDISDYNQFVQDQQTIDEAQNDSLEAHGRDISDLAQTLPGKQDKLESGTNIKTINGLSLLGSGDIEIKLENPEYDHQNILYADYQELPETEKLKNIVYQITDYDIYFVKKTEYLLKIMELEDRITALERKLNN